MCENQREDGNTIRVWVVVVPTRREPSFGRPYGEKANFLSSLRVPDQDVASLGLEVGSIRHIQGIGYGVLEFLGVGTTFDIFQDIHILYLQYDVLTSSGYVILLFIPLWSLVSAATDTPYLP
ncbi:hypothetical protein Tco_0099729 [Tanacetum coccineum]